MVEEDNKAWLSDGYQQWRWSTKHSGIFPKADEGNDVTDYVPTNEYTSNSVFVNLHALVSDHYTNPARVGRYKVEPSKWLDEHRESCGLPATFSESHLRELLLQTRATVPEFSVQRSDGVDDAYFIAFFPLDAVLERLHLG